MPADALGGAAVGLRDVPPMDPGPPAAWSGGFSPYVQESVRTPRHLRGQFAGKDLEELHRSMWTPGGDPDWAQKAVEAFEPAPLSRLY
jgi:hypothetical protein